MSQKLTVIFDLDGTLIDSVADIATSVNILLAKESLPPLTVDEVRAMIGNGMAKLVERAFKARGIDLEGDRLTDMTARMMDIYKDHLTEETILLDGAEDMLRAYSVAGIRIAVVTNKPEAFSRRILDHFGLESARDLPGLKELRAAGLLDNRPPPGVMPQMGEGDQDAEEETAEGQSELFED